MVINDIVRFEQLGPDVYFILIGLGKGGVSSKYFSYFSMKTYVVGTH